MESRRRPSVTSVEAKTSREKKSPEETKHQLVPSSSRRSSNPSNSQERQRSKSKARSKSFVEPSKSFIEPTRGRMVASVCDAGVPSRSRRVSRDVMTKRAARSLSRAVSTSRQRSKSRASRGGGRDNDDEADPVFSKSSRRYTNETTVSMPAPQRSSRPERHRYEGSDISLFSKDDRTNSHDDSHHGRGNRSMIKMTSKSRPFVPPPPPRKNLEDKPSYGTATPDNMHCSHVSDGSNYTESTHPSTSFNSSNPDMSVALVPYGGNQEKALPLPPSKERRHSCSRKKRDDRLHSSHRVRGSKLEEESLIDISTRSESRVSRSRGRMEGARSHSRSKSRSRRAAVPPREDYDPNFNESTSSGGGDAASVEKPRRVRRSRDMNRINLRDVQRSLSRNTRRKSTETEGTSRNARSKSKSRKGVTSTVSIKGRRDSSGTLASVKSKPSRELSSNYHDDSSQSVGRCYQQIEAHLAANTNEFKDPASTFTPDRDQSEDQRSHRRTRSSRNSSSHQKSLSASSVPTPPSSSRPSRHGSGSKSEIPSHHDIQENDLLSNPSCGTDETPVLNLVIDDTTGSGSFSVPTLYASITGSVEKHLQLFSVQLNEPSREFFIQTSMGLLHKIREIHPKTNILRTLSYWNGLQKKRYHDAEGYPRGGGQLGISKAESNNKHEVIMTLVGKYHNRDWEYDEDFHIELENFVEDALRFHACLNGLDENEVQEAQRKKRGMRFSPASVTGSSISGSKFGGVSASSHEDWMGKKVLCKVLEKITG